MGNKMIRLTDEITVAADQIAEIEIMSHRDYLNVSLNSGRIVSVYADYNKSIWQTRDRLITEINAASNADNDK